MACKRTVWSWLVFTTVVAMVWGYVAFKTDMRSEIRGMLNSMATPGHAMPHLPGDPCWRDPAYVDALCAMIVDVNEEEHHRHAAISLLAQINNHATNAALIDILEQLVAHQDEASQSLVISGLLGASPKVMPELRLLAEKIIRLHNQTPFVFVAAVRVIADTANADDVPLLCFLYRSMKTPGFQDLIIRSIEHALGIRFVDQEPDEDEIDGVVEFEAWLFAVTVNGGKY